MEETPPPCVEENNDKEAKLKKSSEDNFVSKYDNDDDGMADLQSFALNVG